MFLRYTNFNIQYFCDKGGYSDKSCKGYFNTKVSFYFILSESKKELVIIENDINECIGDCFTMLRLVEKNIIPIEQIKSVDILEQFYGKHGIATVGKIALLIINTEFDANSIEEQIVCSRKLMKDSDEISYENKTTMVNYAILYVTIKEAEYLKEAIDKLVQEYKK